MGQLATPAALAVCKLNGRKDGGWDMGGRASWWRGRQQPRSPLSLPSFPLEQIPSFSDHIYSNNDDSYSQRHELPLEHIPEGESAINRK